MSREIKFTPETKESVVLDYIKGSKSVIQICNELHISTSTFRNWVAIYNKHGLIGFAKKTKNNSYTNETTISSCLSKMGSSS